MELKLETEDGSKINPTLSMAEGGYELETIQFPYFDSDGDGIFNRPIPTRQVTLANGDKVRIATIFDLMASQYGVRRFDHKLDQKDTTMQNQNIHLLGKKPFQA